ncbi:MAG TPA: penicillin acylase family protein [Solirubrobacterales bacterium]|jgi:acyl-homoserine lactone acylase PvdQ
MRRVVYAVGAVLLILFASASASAKAPKDPTIIARNILPSGQYGTPNPNAGGQAELYNALTPLFDQVTPNDLFTDFKSEKLGIDTDGPVTQEPVPFPGVTLLRDRFNIPHVYASTRAAGIQTAGWILAEDRSLLLEQARYNARVAVIDAPGLSAIGLTAGLQSFKPSAQTEAFTSTETKALKRQGKEGKAVLRDIDTYVSGINAYLAASKSPNAPWTRNDVYAVNALKGQFLGQGGGDEADRSSFLNGLQQQLGKGRGFQAFNDLRQFKNPKSVTSINGTFPYGHIPRKHPGSVVIDHNSFTPTPAVPASVARRFAPQRVQASNELMVSGRRSTTGHPILVGGPQISYFFPGLVLEIDMHAPHLNWRGATSAPFPGYLLIGRTPRFATTLTSASSDIIDQYAETLCGGSNERYLYKGKCRTMGRFDAGTLGGKPVSFLTTVHGPVVGYARVRGRTVAISSKRSSRGKDVLDQLFFRRLSNGSIKNPKDFYRAASLTPQTFNSFYIDSKHIAEYTSGRDPIRNPNVDPGLPTKGTGKYEWRGFLKPMAHMHGKNPKQGYMTNWNNGVARGFGAADDEWMRNGSVERVNLLNFNLKRLQKKGRWSPAAITSAMNAAATQDVRAIAMVPLLDRLLRGTTAPSPQAAQMLSLMNQWRAQGGNRLDLNGDGKIDLPGAAIMDAAYTNIVNNAMAARLGQALLPELNGLAGRWDAPPGGQYDGWYQYFDRDIRALLAKKRSKVPDRFNLTYCGKGRLGLCRSEVWNAIQAAGNQLTAEQGTSDPAAWRASATDEQIEFSPLPLITMRYTNRPSGIQQVISFKK